MCYSSLRRLLPSWHQKTKNQAVTYVLKHGNNYFLKIFKKRMLLEINLEQLWYTFQVYFTQLQIDLDIFSGRNCITWKKKYCMQFRPPLPHGRWSSDTALVRRPRGMFLCYTHLKEDQTAKSYSLHTVGQPFWARSISNIPLPYLQSIYQQLRDRESGRGKGLYDVCVCVCMCVCVCVCVCVFVCVCVCVRNTLVDRYAKSDSH